MFKKVLKQIQVITSEIIRIGLCNNQNAPKTANHGNGRLEIGIDADCDLSIALKNRPYVEIYDELLKERAFNILMLDGAIIQMSYIFYRIKLLKHRLAYFPSPYLQEYQNNPEIYDLDDLFAEVTKRNIVPVPIRFDFDPEEFFDVDHPATHLTLGQYENCRIPVFSPLTPSLFLSFILRNFYNTGFKKFSNQVSTFSEVFDETITPTEKMFVHIGMPCDAAS